MCGQDTKRFKAPTVVVAMVDNILAFVSFRADQFSNLRSVHAKTSNKGVRFNDNKLQEGVQKTVLI